jgi:citrate lyase subunit gamma (acyl carrier protein)
MAVVKKLAAAGTLESCDAMVTIGPADTLKITLESSVKEVFGENILVCVKSTLERLGVDKADVFIQDRGAFDCTLSARVETAVLRSCGESGEL